MSNPKFDEFVGLPDKIVRYNGGQRCDMLIGPCSCGAWHNIDEVVAVVERTCRLENDIQFLQTVIDSVQRKHFHVLTKYRNLRERYSKLRKKHATK